MVHCKQSEQLCAGEFISHGGACCVTPSVHHHLCRLGGIILLRYNMSTQHREEDGKGHRSVGNRCESAGDMPADGGSIKNIESWWECKREKMKQCMQPTGSTKIQQVVGSMKNLITQIKTACSPSTLPALFLSFPKYSPPTTISHPLLDLFTLSDHTDGFHS